MTWWNALMFAIKCYGVYHKWHDSQATDSGAKPTLGAMVEHILPAAESAAGFPTANTPAPAPEEKDAPK